MADANTHPTGELAELALGVLEDWEAVPVREHLATCAPCRVEYDEMESAAAFLPFGTEEATPPAHLRESILGAVAADPRQIRSAPTVIRRRPVFWWAAAAASALVVAAVSAFVGYAANQAESDDRAQVVVQAAASGNLKLARAADGAVSVTFVHAPSATQGFVWVENLPPLPAGKAYQAWFTPDLASFEPSAVFTAASGGAWLSATEPLDGFVAMGLTIEDAGGATTPSGAPFVVVMLEGSAKRR
ncbi:MAG: anti-sigma factor [Dehalococcoidia bacterium]